MSSQLPRLGLMGIGGVSQMTPAMQSLLARQGGGRAVRGNGTRKRKRNGTKKKATGAKRARKAKSGGKGRKAKFVKGSAAAKAWMAKIRKMRK